MKKKFLFGKNWFFEDFIPGESTSFTWGVIPKKKIFVGKSRYQKVEVFDTERFGRILTLNGTVQLSTRDEFVYHEMLVHPALFYHPNPQKVLIIGGGDGGVLREVVKHPVKEIFLVDIDRKVIEVSKKYLPSVSRGAFEDKRLKIFIEDGLKFVKRYKNCFDIIVLDATDYYGPAKKLSEVRFLKDASQALKTEGIFIAQTAYFQEKYAQKIRKNIKKVFPFFELHKAFVGCFPFDEHTFSVGSKKINLNKVSYKKIKEKYKKLNLKTKYYSPEIHFASAILPKYVNN